MLRMFDYRCPRCGDQERLIPLESRDDQRCECGTKMDRLVSGVMLVGPTDTKPLMLGNGHFKATSSSMVRKYEEATGEATVSTKGSDFQALKWRAKNNATKMVEKMGYTSVEDFRANHSARVDAGEVG